MSSSVSLLDDSLYYNTHDAQLLLAPLVDSLHVEMLGVSIYNDYLIKLCNPVKTRQRSDDSVKNSHFILEKCDSASSYLHIMVFVIASAL